MLRNAATKINHRFLHYTAKTIFSLGAGDPNKNYIKQGPPTVWKNIALIGQASSSGPIIPDLKGKVTAFNRTNGEKLWSFTNTVGPLQILLVLGYSVKMLPKTEVQQHGLDEH
jgi:outer membrane protein assembly factor BamB